MTRAQPALRSTRDEIAEVIVSGSARSGIEAVLGRLAAEYGSADNPDFVRRAAGLGHLLPTEVCDQVRDMRYLESASVLVVRGGPLSGAPQATPAHWSERPPYGSVIEDFWLALVSAQLGDAVCWSSLQDGRLLTDVLPIKGEEDQQTGHGSEAELEFHVEDAFHDDRCDTLALLALRNDDAIPTTVSTAASLDLSTLDLDVLFEARFRIHPDPEHVRDHVPSADEADRIRPVLYGHRESPYLRVDPTFTETLPGDLRARQAFTELCAQLNRNLVDVVLERGDLLLIDNHRAVHGRRRFQARYDGTDRWLRKMTTVRDLRRSRGRRAGADVRAISPFS
ncbi:TauD/TfdA family dioxygenase [Nonomuraea sp. NPDC000554]|uniref:TauD/TfdA family dioxygenase n=1 Tax=Nonomuraea sp. NPDC000554 TaxID=3154259 RepID=UPI003325D3D2